MKYLERSVEGKKIIWFRESNRYSLLEIPAYEIATRFLQGKHPGEISRWCSEQYNIPTTEAERFVNEVEEMVAKQTLADETNPVYSIGDNPNPEFQKHYFSHRFYKAGPVIIAVEYESEDLEYLVHPKFAHLEIVANLYRDYHFRLFMLNGDFVLSIDDTIAGIWNRKEVHYFTGKFSMELLNCMYGKGDEGWMGVFHASAIRSEEQCIMFLGDSGSGKSTVAAILMSAGFDLLADDFVPVDAASGDVFYFPAAVSVKKKAVDMLGTLYPQLLRSREYTYPGVRKTVRYLAAHNKPDNPWAGFPCKALVFIKYLPGSGLILTEMHKDAAFKQLVPDSRLSPLPENASGFLDWFIEMPCYELCYSDNEKMVLAVRELFHQE